MARSKHNESQLRKFREAARALECDEDEGKFNATLGKIARRKTPSQAELEKPADDIGQNDPNHVTIKPREGGGRP